MESGTRYIYSTVYICILYIYIYTVLYCVILTYDIRATRPCPATAQEHPDIASALVRVGVLSQFASANRRGKLWGTDLFARLKQLQHRNAINIHKPFLNFVYFPALLVSF